MKQKISEALNFKLKSSQDKAMFFMPFSIVGNVCMVVFNLTFGILTMSIWFFANAVFRIMIGLSRFLGVRNYIKMRYEDNPKKKLEIGYKTYMNNGFLLIFLGAIYFFISLYMFFNDTGKQMHTFVVLGVATMSFCSLGFAIYGAVKYKRGSDPIINSAKLTNNANALTSIVLTQVVLLSNYGGDGNYLFYNGLTGMVVSITIVSIGVFMLLGMKKYLNKYKE